MTRLSSINVQSNFVHAKSDNLFRRVQATGRIVHFWSGKPPPA